MSQLTIEEIDDIRQSPRQFVDLETVENLSDTAMFQDMQIKELRAALVECYKIMPYLEALNTRMWEWKVGVLAHCKEALK